MNHWLESYRGGEHGRVWTEMQALGAGVRSPEHAAAAEAVARETMVRARRNILTLIERLRSIGYAFAAPAAEPDFALELRISRALAYASASGGEYRRNPWAHPALAWVEEEEALPARFAGQRLPLSVFRRAKPLPAGAAANLSLARRAFHEVAGAVDFRGRHPYLAPKAAETGPEPLIVAVRDIEMAVPDATAGEPFVSALRRSFQWGGFPGWERSDDPPRREIEYLRKGLEPL
jgi:hypothetical protein